jgi:hypothetical protein
MRILMMDVDPTQDDVPAPPEPALEWVMELLRSKWPESPDFQHRCDRAVLGARQVALLRRQIESAGEWVPRPAPDYLRALAAAARVPLDRVTGWAGLPPDLLPGAAFAAGWGRLARTLGLGLRQASLSYRLAFARAAGLEPPMLLVSARHDAPGRPALLEDWEVALAQSFSACGPETFDALVAAEDAIRLAYDTAAAEETQP